MIRAARLTFAKQLAAFSLLCMVLTHVAILFFPGAA